MNVAVISLRNIIKLAIRFIILILSLIVFCILITKKIYISQAVFEFSLKNCLSSEMIGQNLKLQNNEIFIDNKEKIFSIGAKFFKDNGEKIKIAKVEENIIENTEKPEELVNSNLPTIPSSATTEEVSERNITASSTNSYGTVKIKNQSDYELTQEMLTPDVELTNKKDVLIFHTHTCECYTPSEEYQFEMTGNYRTTDANYNMIRVGKELANCLTGKGFSVEHDTTVQDYPSYTGSYDRSLISVQNLLYGKSTELVFDIHRDAVGAGDTYGPTVKINGESVAQLMFVIGTDGGGLEHPNWVNNLKIAIMIQEKANEMYPGLFRPIVIRNSRYNQHLAKGACIIEVGATANTLKEAMLSMQCLANVLAEI